MTTLPATNDSIDPTGAIYELAHAHMSALGITVIHDPGIPPDDIGVWESSTSTLYIRPDATLKQSTWLIAQLIEYLGADSNMGCGRVEPLLTIVHSA